VKREEYGASLEEGRAWSIGTETLVADHPHGVASSGFTFYGSSSVLAWSDRLLFGALVLVLVMSPFEAGYRPLPRFFLARFTNLELTLLVLTVAWLLRLAVDPSARSRLARMPLLLPILVLALGTVLSWVFGEYTALGANYLYRLLMGVIVCLAAWEALSGTRRLVTAVTMLVAAGFLSAVLGLLEFVPWINIEPLLAAFKPLPTTVGGALRLSGSFEYANGAAMFFEVMLPLALGLAVYYGGRKAAGGRQRIAFPLLPSAFFPFVACAVFMVALLLTLSRAALVGTGIALGLFGLAGLIGARGARVPSREQGNSGAEAPGTPPPSTTRVLPSLALAVSFMALGAAYLFFTQPMFRLRLVSENDSKWYNVTYQAGAASTLSAREWVTVPVTVRNDGPMIWRAEGPLAVHLSYHWLSADMSQIVFFEGARTPLPNDVGPGESATVQASLVAPPQAGTYNLQWDMVQENVIWFSAKSGTGSELVRQEVGPALANTTPWNPSQAPGTSFGMPSPVDRAALANFDAVDRAELWKAAFAMFRAHPITGVGPDAFRNLYGAYAGVTNWNKNIYTNNTYIEFFANLGLLGGLAFLWLAGLALWHGLRGVLRGPADPRWAIGLGVTAALAAFLVHGFLDYFLFSTPMYTVFWFLLAAAAGGSVKRET
jgi:hypothetical protein